MQPRPVHLADRGGRGRISIEVTEQLGDAPSSRSITFRMSSNGTRGAESRKSSNLAWNPSSSPDGNRWKSISEAICPAFMAAPFICPSTSAT
jgi:hypothetical protein